MFGFFKENKNSGWFSWNGMGSSSFNDSCNTLRDSSCFDKEPERDHRLPFQPYSIRNPALLQPGCCDPGGKDHCL